MQIARHKSDIPEVLIVEIEKLSNLGLGIAKYDGYVIFVENTCPGDVVRVKLEKKNKSYANAKLLEIIEPSKIRVNPFCPMQKICGSCQLQFIKYDEQLKLKKQIVEDTMHSILGKDVEIRDVIPSPQDREYRHKIQYPIAQTRESKRILAGYYKSGTHDIVNIKYCPIQPSYCDDIIEYIREMAKEFSISGYDEKKHAGDLRHIVIRASHYSKNALVVLVINSSKILNKIEKLANSIYQKFDNVVGVAINVNTKKTNLILGEKTQIITGKDYIEEKLCDKVFKVGAKTFFQVNPESANNIFEYVKNYISNDFEHPTILDSYAGIAAFGICLSDVAKKVVSVEEVKESVDLAQQIVNENGIQNIALYNMDAGKFFEQELRKNGKSYDITVLDPPRKGCTQESLDYALKLTKNKIIYVSCNPATLARDLKYLTEQGANIEYIQPFDMFPHTYHIENVAIISL